MISKKTLLYSFVLLCVAAGLCKIIISLPSRTNENDFGHYYLSSRALVEHQDVYGIDLEDAFEKYRFTYNYRLPHPTNPPLLLWVFAPFALMPPLYAFWGWVFIQAVSSLAIIWMMKRVLAVYSSQLVWPFSCAAFLLSSALYYNFVYSQTQLFLFALILGAYLLHRQHKPVIALTVAVIAGMIKLYPLVFVPWFIWRGTTIVRKRVMYSLYALLLLGGIVLATGLGLWIDFFKVGMPSLTTMP